MWTRRDGFRFVELEESERDLFDFYRAHGAVRQVAAELCAIAKRGVLDAIAALYKDDSDGSDLDCWNVFLEFDGYSAEINSVWGLGYAQSKAAQEAALQVAREMETNGYTITSKHAVSRSTGNGSKPT